MRILKNRLTISTVAFVLAAAGILAQQPPAGGSPTPPPGAPQTPGGRGPGGGRGPTPGGFERIPPRPFPDAPEEQELSGTKYRVVPVVSGLANPWSLTFLPNGDMLVTEKPGRLRVVRNGKLDPEPIKGTPTVWAVGQGGLLEVLPHPRFADNQFLYLTYSKPCPTDKQATTALMRGKFDGKALIDAKDLFVADNCNSGNPHFGSKLAFGRDGMLYMTVGERGDRDRAQNTNIHGGKILRLTEDGTAPPDNPFVGKPGHKPEIFSYGHRNPQGLAFQPGTDVLWDNEHGPQGGDELNIILAGKNYGWPVASYGREYRPQRCDRQPASLERRDRGTAAPLAALDRHLRHDLLHRRQVPAVEGTHLRRRVVRSGAAPRRVQRKGWTARPRGAADGITPAHP